MPKLKVNDDDCTCETLSWYGKGHSAHCAAVLVATLERDAVKMQARIELMRSALLMCEGIITSLRDRKALDRRYANAALKHVRALVNKEKVKARNADYYSRTTNQGEQHADPDR